MTPYKQVWGQLKSSPHSCVVISAHPALHRRIYKAITKEKWKDTVFHVDLDFQGYKSKLSRNSEGNALTITLHIIPTLDTLFS